VVDTANFLNRIGARIKGAGTDLIRIRGVDRLNGGEYAIIPDQIEAGTYMVASAITGGDVTVANIIPKHMDSITAKLKEIGCTITEGDDYIQVSRKGDLHCCNIKATTYPGFPTDLHPQISALLCMAQGMSFVNETVWEHRFQYVNELKRLGANINVKGRTAVIEGVKELSGARVKATDLRAGASLVIAGLAAKGETLINNIKHLDRGYEGFVEKLQNLGADIKRIEKHD
jgi:UDP-N-acetylglucosamine 1-carboxyvinyltransferase